MRVFISSLIAGFEAERDALKKATQMLRHQPIMAEDFPAQVSSPQVACLSGVRGSDLVILVLGDRYGAIQTTSNISATHEEYRAAKGTKPVIAFVKEHATFEPEQKAFVDEVQGWEGGLFRGSYSSAEDLYEKVVRSIHEYELANAVGTADPVELRNRAGELVRGVEDYRHSSRAVLRMAFSGGPQQQIIRPADLESEELKRKVHQAAAFGAIPFIDAAAATTIGLEGDILVLKQDRGSEIALHEDGSVVLASPLDPVDNERTRFGSSHLDGSVLIEERVVDVIQSSLAFADWLLEAIDHTQRITHLGIAATIVGSQHRAWRTAAEHRAQSGSVSFGFDRAERNEPILVDRPRAAMRMARPNVTEDLMVGLRRKWPRG